MRYNSLDVPNKFGAFGPDYTPSGPKFHIFSTVVSSRTTQTLRIGLAGDDGHSLFVDGNFVTGGGFGGTATDPNAAFDLQLVAGIPVQLILAGHDAYGGSWIFGITDPTLFSGVTIRATNAPEPSNILLIFAACVSIAGFSLLQKKAGLR